MALILGRHRSQFVSNDSELDALIGNEKLSENFVAVARDMDLLEPKIPEVCNAFLYKVNYKIHFLLLLLCDL